MRRAASRLVFATFATLFPFHDFLETLALREHATLLSLSKMSRYESECALFEEKYGQSFQSVKNRVTAMLNEEDFQAEDDLMDWEFAHVALNWWKGKLIGVDTVMHAHYLQPMP